MSVEQSPNALTPAKPIVARMSSWPLYIVLFALFILGAVLVYSVNFAHNPEDELGGNKKVEVSEQEQPLWLIGGSGLTLDEKKEQTSGIINQPVDTPTETKREPLLIVQESTLEDEEALRFKRLKAQAFIAALSAPLKAKNSDKAQQIGASNTVSTSGNVKQDSNDNNVTSEMGAENRYDPASDRDKESFFARSKSADSSWMLENVRMSGQKYEIKTGTVVPSVMITGINSDLPGSIMAQVSQNVYDTKSGLNLLIPQGAKIYGVYDSRVIYGQSRVLVAWNRIIFPDGSAITLGSMPGSDMSGNAGFADSVDNHYFRIFGSAVLMSLVTGGMAYTMDSLNSSGDDEVSMQNEMTTALAAQLGQATTTLLQKNLSIKPTLEIRTGYQFNIVVTKDIIFEEPYAARQ